MIFACAPCSPGRDAEVASGERTEDRGRERRTPVPARGEAFGPERGRVGADAWHRRSLAQCLGGESRAPGYDRRAAPAQAEGAAPGAPAGRARKDRHVVAAAVKAGAQVITTSNLKDFSWLPEGAEVQSPDEFLCNA